MEEVLQGVRVNIRKPLIIIALMVGAIAIFALVRSLTAPSSASYITAPVQYSDINATIQETGTVNPVNQVNVGTQVSGTIATLYVDYNSIVHKGQVLARIDSTSFRAAADQAHAGLDSARAQAAASGNTVTVNAANAQNVAANLSAALANVKKAAVQEALSRVTLDRDRALLSEGYIPQSQYDIDTATERSNLQALRAAEAAANGGNAQFTAARAQQASSQNQAAGAQAQVEAAAAQAEQADYNLSRTAITSPIDGIVVSRNVSVGQTVAASLQTPTLFVLATSLKDMEVDVSVDEADVGQLLTGQTAHISVPAYPNVDFKGVVHQVRVNPTNVQNVVTYDAVVFVHDEKRRLLPGMTANVTIDVVHRHNVLSVPMAALLYRPADVSTRSTGGAGATGARNTTAASAGSGAGATAAGVGSKAGVGSSSAVPAVAGAPGSHVTLWVLNGKRLASARVVIGYSDGINVEILQGDLHVGDRVVTSELRSGTARATSPGGFGPGFGGGR